MNIMFDGELMFTGGWMRRNLDNIFTYHPPKPGQPEKYAALRTKAKELAELIADSTPECREQDEALDNLEQSVMWANAAIARNG